MIVEAPIIVTGLDHSGKTPLRMALDHHPAFVLVRRLDLWTTLRRHYVAASDLDGPSAFRALLTRTAIRHQLDEERLALALKAGSFHDLAIDIGRQLCARAGARRWGIQEANLELRVDIVLSDFPRARIIHVVRDPRDRAARMVQSNSLGRTGVAAETAAWIASTSAAQAAAARLPERVRIVRYESFLGNPEALLSQLCAFLGEEYSNEMLDAETMSKAHRAELSSEIGRFTSVLGAHQIRLIESHAADLMAAFGYPATQPVTRGNNTFVQSLADAARWRAGRLAWWTRSRQMKRESS